MYFQKKFGQKISLLLAVGLILAGCNVGATPAPTIDVNAMNTHRWNHSRANFRSKYTNCACQPNCYNSSDQYRRSSADLRITNRRRRFTHR